MPLGMTCSTAISARVMSSRMSPRVSWTSTPRTSLRFELASASTAKTGPFFFSQRYSMNIPQMVVFPTPPFPAKAMVCAINAVLLLSWVLGMIRRGVQ